MSIAESVQNTQEFVHRIRAFDIILCYLLRETYRKNLPQEPSSLLSGEKEAGSL
jgi:hypothetical protein